MLLVLLLLLVPFVAVAVVAGFVVAFIAVVFLLYLKSRCSKWPHNWSASKSASRRSDLLPPPIISLEMQNLKSVERDETLI